jgi:hypothetical protein
MSELIGAYERLRQRDDLLGSHLSIDRDSAGEEYVQIAPDWIEGPVLLDILKIAREFELVVTLTKNGLRIDHPTNETVQSVEQVKRVLAEDDA